MTMCERNTHTHVYIFCKYFSHISYTYTFYPIGSFMILIALWEDVFRKKDITYRTIESRQVGIVKIFICFIL